MSANNYILEKEFINDQENSYLPDVAFHPNGEFFAVSYRDNNEVRLFDANSLKLLRTLKNPESQLAYPHGLLFTDNHLIVTNKMDFIPDTPSIITVYQVNGDSPEPVCVLQTPLEHMRESHSMDIHNGKLLVTYCGSNIGAVLTFNFNDKTGQLTGPDSILEDWFSYYGEPKGIAFNKDGSKAFVTIAIGKKRFPRLKKTIKSLVTWSGIKQMPNHHFNGVVVFDVDKNGALSKKPVKIIPKPKCRLENINIVDDKCVMADPLNEKVYIYNFDEEVTFDEPVQVIDKQLAFPHDACLSPDKQSLLISNYGIAIENGYPQWAKFRQPRADKFMAYRIAN